MTERRSSWDNKIAEELAKRQERKQALFARLQAIRTEIHTTSGTDFKRYDALKQEEREITAMIGTL